MPRELPIPPAAAADPKAIEIARVWTGQDAEHVALAAELWDDPAQWGLMLVDLARHVANAYEQTQGRERGEVLRRLRAGFDAEWDYPTDDATGRLLD